MQFLVYIVVLLVALGGVLVELDWLTKPKLEPKAMQTASVAAPAPDAKVDGPSVELSPVYRTSPPPDETPAPAPAAASAPPANAAITGNVPAETTGLGGPALGSGPALGNSFTAVPPQPPMASFQPAVRPQPATQAPVREVAAPANSPVAKPEPKSAALQSPNHCDVAACAGMYTSFLAADCSYQPLEGPRKLCITPSGNAQKAAAEPRDRNANAAARKDKDSVKRSKEAELRAVERKVREITSRETQRAMAQEDDDADIDSALPGGRRVIIIRRGPRW